MADLAAHLNAELYQLMVSKWLPFSTSQPLDYGMAIDKIFNKLDQGEGMSEIRPKVWAALKAISTVDLDDPPNMMTFLPPVEHPDFPQQALGLQLVLDQGPRAFCKGVDARYTNGFFGKISIQYAQQLQALPAELNPTRWVRWEKSVSIDYYLFMRLWWFAPFVHHESMAEQAIAYTEEGRKFVEEFYNAKDPYREQPEKRWDMYGFPKMLKEITAGVPGSPCSVADGCFFLACLMDVHYPPLKKFGRYPYQNGNAGRVPTSEEIEWMENSEFFRDPPDDVKRRIREDVENNRWSPLSD